MMTLSVDKREFESMKLSSKTAN